MSVRWERRWLYSVQLFDSSFITRRCCHSHIQCHSTLQRRLSLCWAVWKWMTRRWQRQRCRSSRIQAARWRRVFLTSNREFHEPNLADLFALQCCVMCSDTPGMQECIIYTLTKDTLLCAWPVTQLSAVFLLLMVFSRLLPQVFYCRYYRPKPREALPARLNMPSTASMPCSATETHTLPKSLRSVSQSVTLVPGFYLCGQWERAKKGY